MSKGPIVRGTQVEIIITETYLKHRKWSNKDIWREVKTKVREQIKEKLGNPGLSAIEKKKLEEQLKSEKWPGKSVVEQILAALRKKDKESAKNELELPWNLGVSALHNIPQEANKDLLRIWKWCVAVGDPFTIREARWIAKLRGIPISDFHIRRIVSQYATRERASELLGLEKIDTSDLDARLAFLFLGDELWAYLTAISIGAISSSGSPEESVGITKWGELSPADKLHPLDTKPSDKVRDDLGLGMEKLDYEMGEKAKLSEDGNMVYALWLRTLSKGPNWQKMSSIKKREIARRLYKEVAEVLGKINNLERERKVDFVVLERDWMPRELLHEVGYKVSTVGGAK